MDNTQLQIIISLINNATSQLDEVSEQLTGLGTTATEAAAQMSSSLTEAENAIADASVAAASQWDDSIGGISTAVEDASGSIAKSFENISESALASANAMSEGWQASIAELETMMTQADATIVEGATTAGEQAGTAAGEGFGSYFKKMIVGYALEQIGSFLSGGIDSAIAAVSKGGNQIAAVSAQIQQQKADIQVNEAALQKWVGTTVQVNAAHVKAAANIEAEKVKITELTQQLAPLTEAHAGLAGEIQNVADEVLIWISNHKQLESELQTFTTTLGPILQYIGEALIVITLLQVALSVLDGPLLILIGIGVAIALLTAVWQTFHTQITAFLADLDAKTGIITAFRNAWQSIVNEFDTNLKPSLAQLWTALQPLMPYIKDLAEVAFFLLIKAIEVLVPLIVGAINSFTDMLTISTKIATFFTNVLVAAIHAVGDALNAVFNSAAFKAVGGLIGGAIGGIGSAIGAVSSAAGSILKVNDAIITPSGQVIQTDVADYLFATKNPGAIGGAGVGGGITININGGNYLNQGGAQQIAQALATMIGRQIKLRNFA